MRTIHSSTIGMIALAAVACIAGCNRSESKAEIAPATGPGAPPPPELPSLTQPQEAAETVATARAQRTTGTTFPREQAQVAPSMSGILAKVAVEEGDTVKKNQLLFQLRTQDFSLGVSQAQAAVKSAEVGLAAVKVEYDRTQRLLEKNAVNQAAWDQVRAQYDGAQAGVEQAKVALAMARKALADATVRSPIAGVVTHKLKSAGEMVTMMPPTPVVIIEDHSVLELRFRLPERYLREIKKGDVVTASFSAVSVTSKATVTRLSPGVDPTTRTFEVIAEIPNEDGQLKAGMLATVDVGAAPADAPPKKAEVVPTAGTPAVEVTP